MKVIKQASATICDCLSVITTLSSAMNELASAGEVYAKDIHLDAIAESEENGIERASRLAKLKEMALAA